MSRGTTNGGDGPHDCSHEHVLCRHVLLRAEAQMHRCKNVDLLLPRPTLAPLKYLASPWLAAGIMEGYYGEDEDGDAGAPERTSLLSAEVVFLKGPTNDPL